MADVKAVLVRLVAEHDQFKRGMKESGDATAQFGKVAAVGLAAAAAAGTAFALKSADSFVTYGKEVSKLSRISGENVETSSKMVYAAQRTGLSADQLSSHIKFLERSMATANPAFDKLGVSVRDSGGNMRDVHGVLLDTAEAISQMNNGAEKSALILQIFGRSGLDLEPLLNKGREGILALEEEAKKYGLVLTEDNLKAIAENVAAHRELDAAMQGLEVRVGQNVVPILTSFTGALARIPGPMGSVTAALSTQFVAVTAVGAALVQMGPTIKAFYLRVTEGGTLMGDSLSALALVAIPAALKGLDEVKQSADEMAGSMEQNLDWTHGSDRAAVSLQGQIDQVNQLNDAWADKRGYEMLVGTFTGERRQLTATNAQLEQHVAHYQALQDKIITLAGALGITSHRANELANSMGVDLTKLDPAVYTPIFQALANGSISSAEAQLRLRAASVAATGALDDQKARIKELSDANEAANAAETALFGPSFAAMDAARSLEDAQRGVTRAEEGLAEAHRSVAQAQDDVARADRRREDAARRVSAAVDAHAEAQRRLDDLLRGPTADETLNIESAQVGLLEAQRRARGETGTDPELEKRRNLLDVRRAELTLSDAQAAHGEAVASAQDAVAAAAQAETDARLDETEAIKGVDDAHVHLAGAMSAVKDAELTLGDAHRAVWKAALDADVANRNLLLGFGTGEADINKARDALDRWVTQGQITREEADRMAWAMLALRLSMGAFNPDATPEEIARRKAAQDYVNDQDRGHAHARGGSLDEGWNLLGEEGPELAYKSGALVSIATAPSTRRLLNAPAGLGAGAAGPSGGLIHNGDIVIGTANERTASDIQWEQRKLALELVR